MRRPRRTLSRRRRRSRRWRLTARGRCSGTTSTASSGSRKSVRPLSSFFREDLALIIPACRQALSRRVSPDGDPARLPQDAQRLGGDLRDGFNASLPSRPYGRHSHAERGQLALGSGDARREEAFRASLIRILPGSRTDQLSHSQRSCTSSLRRPPRHTTASRAIPRRARAVTATLWACASLCAKASRTPSSRTNSLARVRRGS